VFLLLQRIKCHPRECNSCSQNANRQIMLLYPCRSQPNTHGTQEKSNKIKNACRQAGIPPVNSHSHYIFSLFLYGVWMKHNCAYSRLQLLQTFTIHLQSDKLISEKWNDKTTTTTPVLFFSPLPTTPSRDHHHPCVGTLS
jgi:hypothetical protein